MRTLICKLLFLLIYIGYGINSGDAYAHGGDERGIPQVDNKQIISYGRYIVADKIRRGELPLSWERSSLDRVSQFENHFQREWMIMFYNRAAQVGEQRLFIFFDLDGAYLGSNFSGK